MTTFSKINKKNLLIALVLLIAVALLIAFYVSRRVPSELKGCETRAIEGTMADQYLKGFLEMGQKYDATLNWYRCNPVQRGDLVLFRLSTNLPLVVKIVRGIAGDRFEVKADASHKHWNLWINGKIVLDHANKPYYFGGTNPPTLSLYEKPRKGILLPNEAIVLSSLSPGNADSAAFGVTSVSELVGKVSTRPAQ